MLLDTCVLIWLVDDQTKLSQNAHTAIADNRGDLQVSAATALELSLKCNLGKLEFPCSPEKWYSRALALHGLGELPIDGTCACLAGMLPLIHRDPCDRLIIATALIHRMPIVTPDAVMPRYPGVQVIW
jgi:PIN domain nuclease of toxin-antitoxin system